MITGSSRIPLSHLQGGPIFYKYALVNTYSQERECKLEQISLEHSDVPDTFKYNAQLYRVMNVPKTEIKEDGKALLFTPKSRPEAVGMAYVQPSFVFGRFQRRSFTSRSYK